MGNTRRVFLGLASVFLLCLGCRAPEVYDIKIGPFPPGLVTGFCWAEPARDPFGRITQYQVFEQGQRSPDGRKLLAIQTPTLDTDAWDLIYPRWMKPQEIPEYLGYYDFSSQKFTHIYHVRSPQNRILAFRWLDNTRILIIRYHEQEQQTYFEVFDTIDASVEVIEKLDVSDPVYLQAYPWFVFDYHNQIVRLNMQTLALKRTSFLPPDRSFTPIQKFLSISEEGDHIVFQTQSPLNHTEIHNTRFGREYYYETTVKSAQTRPILFGVAKHPPQEEMTSEPHYKRYVFVNDKDYPTYLSFSPLRSKYVFYGAQSPRDDYTGLHFDLELFENTPPFYRIGAYPDLDILRGPDTIFGSRVIWLDEAQFIAVDVLQKPQKISLLQFQNERISESPLSKQALYLGESKAHTVFWMDIEDSTLVLKAFKEGVNQVLKSWEQAKMATQTLAESQDVLWFEVVQNDAVILGFELDLHSMALTQVLQRNIVYEKPTCP